MTRRSLTSPEVDSVLEFCHQLYLHINLCCFKVLELMTLSAVISFRSIEKSFVLEKLWGMFIN